MVGYIYYLKNIKTNKFYIGFSTRPLKITINSHILFSKKPLHALLYREINKYGMSSFEYDIIESFECNNKEYLISHLRNIKSFYINLYNTYWDGYNSTCGSYKK